MSDPAQPQAATALLLWPRLSQHIVNWLGQQQAAAPANMASQTNPMIDTPMAAHPLSTKTCTVDARVLTNDLPDRKPGAPGAYGVPETRGTGVVARDQWAPVPDGQKNAYIGAFRGQVSGWAPNGAGGYHKIFDGISDNMGDKAAVTKLETLNPGQVLIELPGGSSPDYIPGLQLRGIPAAVPCPVPGAPARRFP